MTASADGFHARLDQLPARARQAFMAAVIERMLPNYALYAQMSGSGDAKVLRNVLDLAWEALAVKDAAIDFDKQAEKLAEQEPPENDDSFGARRAVEVVMALAALLDALRSEASESPRDVSRLSRDGVHAYIEMTDGAEDDAERLAARVREHPLMDDEHGFQEAVLEHVEAPLTRDALKSLRRLGRNEGVSNLGLSAEG
ncbi:YjaG family protein [Chromohalobacter nigrandesensis]|uniref:YjaG family protein n=1 Tax=Chromohalobacter nigrandesensis TaxID=119863 RepID=UPI001FF6B8C7|nr:YjaG family protein [Chromohalobacter nigrandesensis]MCK0746744.1 YjaG family protein [Chromohalobacter nigrandesensis]